MQTDDNRNAEQKVKKEQAAKALLALEEAVRWGDYAESTARDAVLIHSILYPDGVVNPLPEAAKDVVKDFLYHACNVLSLMPWDDPLLAMTAWVVLTVADSDYCDYFINHSMRAGIMKVCDRETWQKFLTQAGIEDTKEDTPEDWREEKLLFKLAQRIRSKKTPTKNRARLQDKITALAEAAGVTLTHPAVIASTLDALHSVCAERPSGDEARRNFYQLLESAEEGGAK